MALQALFLNCTLKKSPYISKTEALVEKAATLYGKLGVESEVLRPVNYAVGFGVSSDMGKGNQQPVILE